MYVALSIWNVSAHSDFVSCPSSLSLATTTGNVTKRSYGLSICRFPKKSLAMRSPSFSTDGKGGLPHPTAKYSSALLYPTNELCSTNQRSLQTVGLCNICKQRQQSPGHYRCVICWTLGNKQVQFLPPETRKKLYDSFNNDGKSWRKLAGKLKVDTAAIERSDNPTKEVLDVWQGNVAILCRTLRVLDLESLANEVEGDVLGKMITSSIPPKKPKMKPANPAPRTDSTGPKMVPPG